MDSDDNVFSYAPVNVQILRGGQVQDPMVTPIYPETGSQVSFIVEGSDVPTTIFPPGGQLDFRRMHRAENEATEITPGQPRALFPFYMPGTPNTRGTYFVDAQGELYDYQPNGWRIRTPGEEQPEEQEHDDEDEDESEEDDEEEDDEDEESDEEEERPLRALLPRLTEYGVRFVDPEWPNDPLLRTIPRDREVDLSDVAGPEAYPPRNFVAEFTWRGKTYFIDLKYRLYFSQPMGCFIQTSFREEPAPPPPPKRIPQNRFSPRRSTPSGASSASRRRQAAVQATPLSQVWNAASSSPSKAPTSASGSTSSTRTVGSDFRWLPPTTDMTWRRMGRMVRAARRRLNELDRQAQAASASNIGASDVRPSSQGLTRARRALDRSRATTQRRRDEPEERCRGTQNDQRQPPPPPPPPSSGAASGAASSSAPSAGPTTRPPSEKTPTGSKATQGSTGSKQATTSATGDKYPQPVEVTDRSLLKSTRPITKTYSSSAEEVPASLGPAKRTIPTDQPLKKTPGLRAAQASMPAKASPLRQIQLAGDQAQQSPASPSPSTPGRLIARAKVPTKQPAVRSDFPGFSVRTAQESRSGLPRNWTAANYPPNHSRYLNEAVELLYLRNWFRDENFMACIRLATQRPGESSSPSSSSTQPRTYCFNFALSGAQEQSQVVLGTTSAEARAFQAAELRIIPANSSDLPEIEDMTEWADETQSLGSHWAVGMEHGGTFYYFDTCRRGENSIHRGNHGLRLLGWYMRIRAAAGVRSTLRFKVIDVEPQDDGWESGFLAAELVRKVVQDHNGDPNAVTSWGPQTSDEILQKWARAIIQDLGTAYRSPVPADKRGQDRRTLAFQAFIPPTARQNAPLSSSSSSISSPGRRRPGATQAKRLNVRTRPQLSGRTLHVRRGGADISHGPLLSIFDQTMLINKSSLSEATPIQADHIGSHGGQISSLKRTRLEVESNDNETQRARKMIRRS